MMFKKSFYHLPVAVLGMHASKGPIIEAENLTFSYGTNTVLENVSFSIEEGDYVGIVGPNGSGKTTLLKIILGLLEPTSGWVKVLGNRSQIGFVPQRIAEGKLQFPATVEEIVLSGRVSLLRPGGRFHAIDEKKARKAMEVAGVLPLKDRLINELSGGQAQRVLIARALCTDPKILVLDEPTVGVDIPSQEEFYGFVKELNETMGITILFVSHDIDVIAHETKTVLCLNRTLICHGPSREVLFSEALEKVYGKKLKFILHGH